MDHELAGLFRDLVRVETELWNRVEVRVQQTDGVPLAWLEIMRVVPDATGAPNAFRTWDLAPQPIQTVC